MDNDNQMDNNSLSKLLITKYEEKIMSLLDNQETDLYLREHYAESPNYYGNQEEETMIETLIWLSHSDVEKKDILDWELEQYKCP
jgi:hypothetical protein